MRRMATADRRGREVAWFEDGDLWCSDEAVPPSNPAGWYFRPRGAVQQPWIGPFRSDEAAETSSFSGDALRDARRRLEAWAASAGDEASRDDVGQDAPLDEVPPAALQMAGPVAAAAPTWTGPAAVEPSARALSDTESDGDSPAAASGQLDLGFVQVAVAPASRSPRRGSRRPVDPLVEQIALPL